MEQMFHGVTVDGSTSFVARHNSLHGQRGTVEREEEDATEDIDLQSPMSSNSRKRASSSSTIGSSPGKKKSPSLRMMKEYMTDMAKNQAERNEYFKQACSEKQ
jgi:hypothetical protein